MVLWFSNTKVRAEKRFVKVRTRKGRAAAPPRSEGNGGSRTGFSSKRKKRLQGRKKGDE